MSMARLQALARDGRIAPKRTPAIQAVEAVLERVAPNSWASAGNATHGAWVNVVIHGHDASNLEKIDYTPPGSHWIRRKPRYVESIRRSSIQLIDQAQAAAFMATTGAAFALLVATPLIMTAGQKTSSAR